MTTLICNCAHGAAQRLDNPEVRKILGITIDNFSELSYARRLEMVKENLTEETWIKKNYFFNSAADVAAATTVAGSATFDGARAASEKAKEESLLTVWQNRLEYVRKDYVLNEKNYGKPELSFLLGMFGLTTAFNDEPSTTLSMVHEKIDAAIVWAKANEDFL